jgi:hypothetical protein
MKRCPIHEIKLRNLKLVMQHAECIARWTRGGINAAEIYANQVGRKG